MGCGTGRQTGGGAGDTRRAGARRRLLWCLISLAGGGSAFAGPARFDGTTFRVDVHPASAWTIYRLEYGGHVLVDPVAQSCQGTVLWIGPPGQKGWVGSCHGGETVQATRLWVDFAETPLLPDTTYPGQRFELEKTSELAYAGQRLRLTARLVCTATCVEESVTLTALTNVNIGVFYPWLSTHANGLTRYLAVGLDGSVQTGETAADNNTERYFYGGVGRLAQYDPLAGRGVLTVFDAMTASDLGLIWDRPVDNKLYWRRLPLPSTIPAATTWQYRVVRRPFRAAPDHWVQTVLDLPTDCTPVATMALEPLDSAGCRRGGETVWFEARLIDASAPVRGAQLRLQYDSSVLSYVGGVPGDPPFTVDVADLPLAPGDLLYAVGVAPGGEASATEGVVARLAFTVIGDACAPQALAGFATDTPPGESTLLTGYFGEAIVPRLRDAPPLATDGTPPVVTAGPAVEAACAAGTCFAAVTWPAATAQDACGGDLSALVRYDVDVDADGTIDAADLSTPTFVFPPGTHRVNARVADPCGNPGAGEQSVTVTPTSTARVSVSLGWPLTGTRALELEFGGGGGEPVTRCVPAAFAAGTAEVRVDVPCGPTPYTCVAVRDPLHTLRRRVPLEIIADEYRAVLTGGDALVGGDLDGNNAIDILDFAVYSWRYGTRYPDGDTGCATPQPHADVSGDGLVQTADFTFIATRFLWTGDGPCVSRGRDGTPRPRVSVGELADAGLGHLAGADLNRDGWIDATDMALHAAGQVPTPRPGDLNCDGVVSLDDIDAFVLALTDPAAYAVAFPHCRVAAGDFDGDGAVTLADVDGFVSAF